VRLVHGEGGDVPASNNREEVAGHQPLGGEIDEFGFTGADGVEAAAVFLWIESGVEEGGGNAGRRELVHLVLHQRDQRGNDQRHAVAG
jgi:hypothetical protein